MCSLLDLQVKNTLPSIMGQVIIKPEAKIGYLSVTIFLFSVCQVSLHRSIGTLCRPQNRRTKFCNSLQHFTFSDLFCTREQYNNRKLERVHTIWRTAAAHIQYSILWFVSECFSVLCVAYSMIFGCFAWQ